MTEQPKDLATRYLQRLRDQFDLPERVTFRSLLYVCKRLGISVVFRDDLDQPGLYISHPYPTIILRPDANARVLAHEIFHHLAVDNEQLARVSTYPLATVYDPEEAMAQRFADLLCGDQAAPAELPTAEFDPGNWRRGLSRFERLVAGQLVTGNQVLRQGLKALSQEVGRPVPVPASDRRCLTVEEAESLLRSIRKMVEQGLI